MDRDRVEFRANRVYAGNESVSFSELAQMTYDERVSLSAAGYYSTPGLHWDAAKMVGNPFYYYTYGAAVAEVVIDTLTGENRILRTDLLHDAGASLNPALDIGQVEGGLCPRRGLADDRGTGLGRQGPAAHPCACDL